MTTEYAQRAVKVGDDATRKAVNMIFCAAARAIEIEAITLRQEAREDSRELLSALK